MDETMLTLKTGAALTEVENRVGLTRNGQTKYAKSMRQAIIIRALSERPHSPESLAALLCAADCPQSDNDNSLAIAEFILDFGEFLEA